LSPASIIPLLKDYKECFDIFWNKKRGKSSLLWNKKYCCLFGKLKTGKVKD